MSRPYGTILFVDHATDLGGAENSLRMLAESLRADWTLHLAGQPGRFMDEMSKIGVTPHAVDLPTIRGRNAFSLLHQRGRKLAQIAQSISADFIYTNTVRATFYGAWGSRLSGTKLIWHMRDFWLSESRPKRIRFDTALKSVLTEQASIVFANSKATADHLPKSSKVTVVHNGIEIDQFTPGRTAQGSAFRTGLGIPAEALVVGMAGRMRPWKGQHRFIEIAAEVISKRPQTHFVLIGGNPLSAASAYQNSCIDRVHQLGLTDQIHFAGHIRPISNALNGLDLFVHPGDPEPFGLVNIEAMASGLPVVAFSHGALPEIVLDRTSGRLIPSNDLTQMAVALIDLLEDPHSRSQMGEIGRKRAINHFSVQQTAIHVSEGLKSLI